LSRAPQNAARSLRYFALFSLHPASALTLHQLARHLTRHSPTGCMAVAKNTKATRCAFLPRAAFLHILALLLEIRCIWYVFASSTPAAYGALAQLDATREGLALCDESRSLRQLPTQPPPRAAPRAISSVCGRSAPAISEHAASRTSRHEAGGRALAKGKLWAAGRPADAAATRACSPTPAPAGRR